MELYVPEETTGIRLITDQRRQARTMQSRTGEKTELERTEQNRTKKYKVCQDTDRKGVDWRGQDRVEN